MVKLSELQDADEIHEQDMLDPEYRREYERTQAESDAEIAELLRQRQERRESLERNAQAAGRYEATAQATAEAAMWRQEPGLMREIAGHVSGQEPLEMIPVDLEP